MAAGSALNPALLAARWRGRAQFVVVYAGDAGRSLLEVIAAWRADPQRSRRLFFVVADAAVLDSPTLRAAAPPEHQGLARELAAQWPLALPGLHRMVLDAGRITVLLAHGAPGRSPALVLGCDALLLPAPGAPEPAALRALLRLARPGACVIGAGAPGDAALEAALLAAGFAPAAAVAGGWIADYAPRWRSRRFEPPAAYAGERRAIVVGAGLAGAHMAAELGARGWQIDLIDAGPVPGAGASALAWGLLHPQISSDDNLLARLTRAGYFADRSALAGADADLFQRVGVLQIAAADAEFALWRDAARPFALPAAYARLLDARAAAGAAGLAPRRGGWWFPGGGLVAAGRWCRAQVDASRARVLTQTTVARLEAIAGGWCARDAAGRVLAAAPVAIVAGAWGSARLAGLAHAPVRPVRGRISLLADHDLAGLNCGITGDGYAVRGGDGFVGVGASYELPAPGQHWPAEVPATTVHAGNRQRLARLFDPVPEVITTGFYDGIRAVTRDRLPLAGPLADEAAALARPELRGARLPELPRRPGLYGLFGLGSRGLSLGLLAAQLIAAQIEGEPLPVEAELAAALDPGRFLLTHLRRGD